MAAPSEARGYVVGNEIEKSEDLETGLGSSEFETITETLACAGADEDEVQQSAQGVATTRIQRMCEVCQEQPSKYCCPRCQFRTCSLACVTAHKRQNDCNGVRDRAAFVSLSSYNESNLLSDYHFLEEVTQYVDRVDRHKNEFSRSRRFCDRPFYQRRMELECHKRGIKLFNLPDEFKRRRENTTYYHPSQHKIYWRIEWVFPQAEATFVDTTVLEDCLLGKALKKYMTPDSNDEMNFERLAFYQSAGYNGVVPLLKQERTRTKSKYVELDFSLTIAQNLFDKTVIEYPTVLIILKHHLPYYFVSHEEDKEDGELSD